MSLTKKKFSISALIACLSFLYLAFSPAVLNPFYNIMLGQPFRTIISNFFASIFSFGSIISFIACLTTAVGIFTKFDKIAFAITSALFWLSSVINLITSIVNSFKYEYYHLGFGNIFSNLTYILTYFLFFAVALWLTILFFAKKETPKFLKGLVFVPVAILLLICFFAFFTNVSAIISAFVNGLGSKWMLYSIITNLMSIFNRFVLLIGFTAASFKLADLKKKPKNTVEISEEIVVENVTTE